MHGVCIGSPTALSPQKFAPAFQVQELGELNIYIVGSICGGTGGGLFLDVAYELRYLQSQRELPEKSRIKGLFALGDVYDALTKRVLANTYASLRELELGATRTCSLSSGLP